MKKILIPTDFSDNALHALNYAFNLFGDKAEYTLLNTYEEPRSTSASMVSLREILHEGSEEGLQETLAQIKSSDNAPTNLSILSEYGDSVGTICSTAKIKSSDIIIMGTKGATGLKEVFIGSVASGVIEHAPCPVMSIPHDAPLKQPSNMLFTTDLKRSIDDDHKALLSEISATSASKLTVLSVSKSDGDISVAEAETGYDLHVNFQAIEHAFEVVESDDVEHAISEYATQNEIDMIVTIPRKTSWLERLISSSVSESLAKHSKIPILCLK